MRKLDKSEIIRRLRLGHVSKLLLWRYGSIFPDDDAGREDLRELLLPISLGPNADRIMRKQIKAKAPWMQDDEAGQLMDDINRTPRRLRISTARGSGERLGVSNQQREALKLWTIAPVDMTAEQLADQRKAKKQARKQHRRRAAGMRPRSEYLANSISREKPWEREGISRRTWYRRQKRNGTSLGSTNLLSDWRQTCATPKERGWPTKKAKGKGSKKRSKEARKPAAMLLPVPCRAPDPIPVPPQSEGIKR